MSILADLCLDMGGMSGCINYKKLCLNLRSVVKQCSDAPAVPRVLHTMQVSVSVSSGGGDAVALLFVGGVCTRYTYGNLLTECLVCPRKPSVQLTALLVPPGWVLGVLKPRALTLAAAAWQTRDDIQSMCGSHYMDGCQDCTGTGFSNCPKPLDTLSRLCLGEPATCPPFSK